MDNETETAILDVGDMVEVVLTGTECGMRFLGLMVATLGVAVIVVAVAQYVTSFLVLQSHLPKLNRTRLGGIEVRHDAPNAARFRKARKIRPV